MSTGIGRGCLTNNWPRKRKASHEIEYCKLPDPCMKSYDSPERSLPRKGPRDHQPQPNSEPKHHIIDEPKALIAREYLARWSRFCLLVTFLTTRYGFEDLLIHVINPLVRVLKTMKSSSSYYWHGIQLQISSQKSNYLTYKHKVSERGEVEFHCIHQIHQNPSCST